MKKQLKADLKAMPIKIPPIAMWFLVKAIAALIKKARSEGVTPVVYWYEIRKIIDAAVAEAD